MSNEAKNYLLVCFGFFQVDRVDDLVEGYAQFTSLADEASKGVTVGGTKDPLGRVNVDNNSALVSAGTGSTTAPAQQPFGSPTSRRLQRATTAAAEAGVSLGGSSRQANPVFGERIAGDGFRTSPVFASRFAGDAGVGDGVNGGNPRREVDPVQDPVARDALKLLFAKEGNYVQVKQPCVLLKLARAHYPEKGGINVRSGSSPCHF